MIEELRSHVDTEQGNDHRFASKDDVSELHVVDVGRKALATTNAKGAQQ